ncbi:MAG: diadenylate cyclase CdaA [Lachnospiraceae bacterium]|nr:diadenylate cyclase CdaA [Lachnospiraceae bacterium]
MENILNAFSSFFKTIYFPQIHITDILEILLISFLLYQIICWFKKSRAWTLLKGIAVLALCWLFAAIFGLNTILWIFRNTISVGIIAIIIIFQPELRNALEQLGKRNFIASLFDSGSNEKKERFSAKTTNELVKAVFEMSKNKTGALIVIEQNVALGEYERTGIPIDAMVSSQLLVNIFEHNTPLHDGAVIMRNNRIVAATCYLPLSDNLEINKELGTRHRAGIGISEVSDSMTIIVSEETGDVSVAVGGELFRKLDADNLKKKLSYIQNNSLDVKRFRLWKGKKNEGKNS